MTAKILVLGAGRIGAAIADNLSADYDVTVADNNPQALAVPNNRGLGIKLADLSHDDTLFNLVRPYDTIVGALPSQFGFQALKTVLQAGKPVVDISFFAEDALALDALAQDNHTTALVDFGLAPGLTNLITGRLLAQAERLDAIRCYVGGLPQNPQPPFNYKAPFAPLDVIEEYTRPARLRRAGKDITLPALSEIEAIRIGGTPLEAFNTDGLRSLLHTIAPEQLPNMVEKTVRYPGHAAFIQQLVDAGFFTPAHRQTTAAVLLEQWQYAPGEADITYFAVEAEGRWDDAIDKKETRRWELVDRQNTESGHSSMARTTGYTAAAGVRLLLNDTLPHGVLPPETIGASARWYTRIMQELACYGITLQGPAFDPPHTVE